MPEAKGILPRGDDKDVLYKNPQMCGYFIAAKLDSALDRSGAEALLGAISAEIDTLVARLPRKRGQEKGNKVAAVAVGLAPSFFFKDDGQPRFDPPLPPPAAFAADAANPRPDTVEPLASRPKVNGELFFYVASVFEARVNAFISALASMPQLTAVSFDRGYQRIDGTEPFGYADGLRNVKRADRPEVVFIDRDKRQLEEPAWTDGGSYMAYMKIEQHPEAFAALPDDASRDNVIGRRKGGKRIDLEAQNVDPREEPAEPPPALPATAHVAKVGPRSRHDDTQIFRRGLPFIESSDNGGRPKVGLTFCSFQASLDQFDVVLNDWALNRHFPAQDGGVDALLDPARQPALTTIEKVGVFFVPPFKAEGLVAAVFAKQAKSHKPKEGQLVVRKRVVDQADQSRRFQRGGFIFQVVDAQGEPVGAQFSTDSTGRAICPERLEIGKTYELREVFSPVANVQFQPQQFTMERRRQQLVAVNTVTQPNTPYGG